MSILAAVMCALASQAVYAAESGPQAESIAGAHADTETTSRIISNIHTVTLDGARDSLAATDRQALAERIRTFYYDQFRHSQDPEAPAFLFMSKNADLLMGIGGALKLRAYYDWGNGMGSTSFMPVNIAIPADEARRRAFGTSAASTALFFIMLGQSALGEYRVYIEGGFSGYNNRDFKLKKAYGTLGAVTVGYATTTFADPAAEVPSVDGEGPSNKTSATHMLVRYMPRIGRHFIAAVSVEDAPGRVADVAGVCAPIANRMPAAAAFMQYEWGADSHLRLSALARGISYRNLLTATNHTLPAWGVQLSAVARPAYGLTLYGSALYGRGNAGLTGSLSGGGYDLMPTADLSGRMYAPQCAGWCVGVRYRFTQRLAAVAAFSGTRLFLDSEEAMPQAFRSVWLADAGLFYNLTPRLQFAASFETGRRQNASGASGSAHRIVAGMFLSF